MPPVRPHVSITLPRNFTFHYTDGDAPRTPEPEDQRGPLEPPEPPRQTYRVRRRRAALPSSSHQPAAASSSYRDVPVPSIETSNIASDLSLPGDYGTQEPALENLTVSSPPQRFKSRPKTPLEQMIPSTDPRDSVCDWLDIDRKKAGEAIGRPASRSSGISESSFSSSLAPYRLSEPSCGESCTSPDTEYDPTNFFGHSVATLKMSTSPSPHETRASDWKGTTHRKLQWTPEMDHHLWTTYMLYLQDPTVTPFKMLPGTAPPLGVCHRVSRQAKRSWKGGKTSTLPQTRYRMRATAARERGGTPDTIKPNSSEDTTPTGRVTVAGSESKKPIQAWPRSESATRKRLRMLCMKKTNLSAHYQRLVDNDPGSHKVEVQRAEENRDPFKTLRPKQDWSSFSTYDMTFSLTTSTASTMQEGSFIHQLSSNLPMPEPQREAWPSQPLSRALAHQKSHSLQLSLGLDASAHDSEGHNRSDAAIPPSSPWRLKTPAATQGPSNPTNRPPRLDPPVELHAPMPLPRSFKRRANDQLCEELRQSVSEDRHGLLAELFGAPADTSHRRVRSRGFSLGDMGEGARRLSALFAPPPPEPQGYTEGPFAAPAQADRLAPPTAPERSRRLGSPFHERPSRGQQNNTFPRAFGAHAFEDAASFEQRLGIQKSSLFNDS